MDATVEEVDAEALNKVGAEEEAVGDGELLQVFGVTERLTSMPTPNALSENASMRFL